MDVYVCIHVQVYMLKSVLVHVIPCMCVMLLLILKTVFDFPLKHRITPPSDTFIIKKTITHRIEIQFVIKLTNKIRLQLSF